MTTFELPEEPPIGTEVRDNGGVRWSRTSIGWVTSSTGNHTYWGRLVSDYGPLTVVEPDPYPTPWRLDGVSIVSADGVWLLTVHRKLAERIVKAVNEASQ